MALLPDIGQGQLRTGFVGVLLFLLLLPASAWCADESDEDLFDLDAMGQFEAQPGAQPSAETGFGGANALFSGKLINKAAHDFRRENEKEFLFSDLTYASAKAAITVNPNLAITLEGLFEYELETNWDDKTEGLYDFVLWQGHARWKLGPVDLTVGQQHVTWGLADVINPTDTVNPRNWDRFLDAELGFSKLPAPMARVEWYLPKNFKIDTVVLPFFVPAQVHIVEQDVALFGHDFPLLFMLDQIRENPEFYRFERGLEMYYPDWEQDLDTMMENQEFFDVRTRDLADDFTHAEAAIRFSGSARSVDFSAGYQYLWDDLPTLFLNPAFLDMLGSFNQTPEGYTPIPNPSDIDVDTIMEPFSLTYHRTHAVSADLGTNVGGFGLRAEGLYSFARYTYTEDLRTVRKPIATWVFNADYMFSDNSLLSVVYYSSSMLNYTNRMLMPPTYALALIGFRKPWLDEKLTTELFAAYDFSFLSPEQWREGQLFGEDGMVSPMITYAITDPLKITFGANILFGPQYNLLGMLRENSRGFVSLKYDF